MLLAAGFLSCTDRTESDTDAGIAGEDLKFTFSLSGQTSRATEAGEDELNENLINSIDIFIYEQHSDECVYYQRLEFSPGILAGNCETEEMLGAKQSLFRINVPHDIYAAVNYSGGAIPPGGISRDALMQFKSGGLEPDAIQPSFLMDGMTTMVLNDGIIKNKNIHIGLKRAAAKIRVSFSYTDEMREKVAPEKITKKLVNYGKYTTVMDTGEFPNLGRSSMDAFTSINHGVVNDGNITLYSYENDWTPGVIFATYLIVNIPLHDGYGGYHDNYYVVPVNYLVSPEGDTEINKIKRNRLYDIRVIVDMKGTTNPVEPTELQGSCVIMDWSTREVCTDIEIANFLHVRHTDIEMVNTETFTTTFQSSTPDVTITDIRVDGTRISNGEGRIWINAGQNVKSGDIKITSPVPDNFSPRQITFTVRNGAELSVNVTVIQYPPIYIGSHISADKPSGGSGQTNNYLYILGMFAPDFSGFPYPDEFGETSGHYAPNPQLGRSYTDYMRANAILGYPKLDEQGITIDSYDNNCRVSPKFMLASQYGTTTPLMYVYAVRKCSDYVENDQDTGLRYTDWRAPTIAELYMIDILQNVKASKVKSILEGPYYWSASEYRAIKFMDPRVANHPEYSPMLAAIRCVRDVKE